MPNGLEIGCPAEAGIIFPHYGTLAGQTSCHQGPTRRVSLSELLGGIPR